MCASRHSTANGTSNFFRMKASIWIPHVLCAIVGISAWIEINALFSELGHIRKLPEGWSIASIMVIIVQMGNLAPLIFSLVKNKPSLQFSMVIVLATGMASLVFLSIFWSWTFNVFGSERSIMLYVGTLIAASADCLSNLVFWPYVGQFPRSYITAMGTGESLSSAVSAIVSATQKAVGFGPSSFFLIILGIVVMCSAAFGVLEFKYAASLMEEAKAKVMPISASLEETSPTTHSPVWRQHWRIYMIIASIAFVQNALNLSLLPFACRSYKNAHWISQTALFIASPVSSISASFFQPRKSIIPAVCIWTMTSIFIIVAAALPLPIIKDEMKGTALMACISILSGASLAYSKVSAMLWLRSQPTPNQYGEKIGYNKDYMQRLLTVAGISMQIGSVTGAVSMFLLVNVAKVFPK